MSKARSRRIPVLEDVLSIDKPKALGEETDLEISDVSPAIFPGWKPIRGDSILRKESWNGGDGRERRPLRVVGWLDDRIYIYIYIE